MHKLAEEKETERRAVEEEEHWQHTEEEDAQKREKLE